MTCSGSFPIAEQLASRPRYDRDHHTELTRTLALHLAHGSSKTALARLLNLRRQSLYQRLAKIEELNIDHPDGRTSLSLALAVHQIDHARGPFADFSQTDHIGISGNTTSPASRRRRSWGWVSGRRDRVSHRMNYYSSWS
ncbi:MAG: helix-turn-helix domain-containing protein [Acidimicrobiales bacterium]